LFVGSLLEAIGDVARRIEETPRRTLLAYLSQSILRHTP